MKKWIVLLMLIIVLATLLSACGGQPQISISDANLDLQLGDVVNGEVIARKVNVRNQGQADLVVEAVTTSCGCTTATLSPMVIPPGETGILHIEFDSGAHGSELVGQLMRQVFVATNDPDQPETVIELVANILPPTAP